MAVTIKELSAYCGLSVSTVSKALNNYVDVSEETREQVRAAAEALGYRPSAIARSLKTGRTYNIGVLYSDDSAGGLTHSYFSPVLEAFKTEAEKQGYDITFITHNMGRSSMTYLEHCRYRNVDGVCIVCSHFDDPEVVQLINSDLPVVTIDDVCARRICVQSENTQGVTDLTRHIIDMGHKRIAFIYGDDNSVTKARLACFLRVMEEAGLPVPQEYLVRGRYHNPASTREATLRLLATQPRPTCILMPDDYASLGGMEAIQSSGLRIPEDISIVGYDGVPLIQLCSPRLTTVRQDTVNIGQEAARQLVQLIEKTGKPAEQVIRIPCSLVIGDTVARCEA